MISLGYIFKLWNIKTGTIKKKSIILDIFRLWNIKMGTIKKEYIILDIFRLWNIKTGTIKKEYQVGHINKIWHAINVVWYVIYSLTTFLRGIHKKGSGDVVSPVLLNYIHYIYPLPTNSWDDRILFVNSPVSDYQYWGSIRAGEPDPDPVGAGCFWLLGAGAGAAWKKTRSRSRSRLEKKSGARAGAAKKLDGSFLSPARR